MCVREATGKISPPMSRLQPWGVPTCCDNPHGAGAPGTNKIQGDRCSEASRGAMNQARSGNLEAGTPHTPECGRGRRRALSAPRGRLAQGAIGEALGLWSLITPQCGGAFLQRGVGPRPSCELLLSSQEAYGQEKS